MRHAMDDLGLESLTVLYPGDQRYDLASRVQVVPVADLVTRGARAVVRRAGTRGHVREWLSMPEPTSVSESPADALHAERDSR
jgi:hypothetical protein